MLCRDIPLTNQCKYDVKYAAWNLSHTYTHTHTHTHTHFSTYLVHIMLLAQPVVGRAHGVEHTHHLHGCQSDAHRSKAHYIAEENAD